MVNVLIALCLVLAPQAFSAYEVPVPVFKQTYGVGEPRIVGGQEAARGQFPHQAGITIDGQVFCGGSLIAKTWVMTAAHCVDGYSSFSVALGAHQIRNTNEPGRVTINSRKGIRHEDYNSRTFNNDIALVNLPRQVQLNNLINVLSLPPRSWQQKQFTGQNVRISGWGKVSDNTAGISPTLQFVDLNVISLQECRNVYGNMITKVIVCCSGAQRKSTCNGDSGGSLTYRSGNNLTSLGITSFISLNGCAQGYPSGFTKTPFFVDWISSRTGIPVHDD